VTSRQYDQPGSRPQPRVDLVFVSNQGLSSARLQHVYGFFNPFVTAANYNLQWCYGGAIPVPDADRASIRHPMLRVARNNTIVVTYEIHRPLTVPIGSAQDELAMRLAVIDFQGTAPLFLPLRYLTDGSPGRGRQFYFSHLATQPSGPEITALRSMADVRVFPAESRDVEIAWIGGEQGDVSDGLWPAIHHQGVELTVVRLPSGSTFVRADYGDVTSVRPATAVGPAFQPSLAGGLAGPLSLRAISYVQQNAATGRAWLEGVSRLAGPTGTWRTPRNLTDTIRGGGADMPLCPTMAPASDWGAAISSVTLVGVFPVDPPTPPLGGFLPYIVNLTLHVDSGAGSCLAGRTDLAAGPQDIAMTRWFP